MSMAKVSRYKCSVCGKRFKDEKATLDHGRDYHKKRVLEVKPVPINYEGAEMSEGEHLIESYYN